MEIKKATLSDMFGWVKQTFKLVRMNWGKFALASLTTFLVVLIPLIAFILIFAGVFSGIFAHGGVPADWQAISVIYAIVLVVSVILFPPLLAGWLLLCQKFDGGQSAGVGTLFMPYRSSASWLKMSVASALLIGLYLLLQTAYIGICYKLGLDEDLKNFLLLQLNPKAEVTLSAAFWAAYAGFLIFAQLLTFALMLGFAEAALSANSAVQSVSRALLGAAKNFGTYLVLLVALLFVCLLAALTIGLLIALIAGALALLQNTVVNGIAIAIGVILYIVLMLFIYPLMFSFHYFSWKSILDKGEPVVTADTGVLI
jgi:hypothetical protein